MNKEELQILRISHINGKCGGSVKEYVDRIDRIYTELYEFWRTRLKQKRYTAEAYEFEKQASYYLWILAEQVLLGTWSPKGYKDFKVYHPDRIISAPAYDDRIVEYWLTEKYIKPVMQPKLIPLNMACQENKGQHKTVLYLKQAIEEIYKANGKKIWYFKGDIQGYYDNVSHNYIKKIFSCIDEDAFVLFENILNSFESEECYAKEKEKKLHPESIKKFGVPKGNLPSQWIGITYLNDIDHYITGLPYVLFYVRFMDDFIALCSEKWQCKRLRSYCQKHFDENEMGIRLHPQKTQIAPITTAFKFCGWQFKLRNDGTVRLHVRNDRKELKETEIRQMQSDYARGLLSFEDIQLSLQSVYAYYKLGDTKILRKYLSNKYRFRRK